MILLSAITAKADEGMWTLYNLPEAVYKQMQAEGFTMPYDQLYSSDNAIKNCVINFSGYCSGVVVSPNGLVFTNHHCGFESIRSHSTVENDYMLNGFIANSYEEELPKHGLTKGVSEYYYHSVSHHLGLDTHDVDGGPEALLEAGNVITDEPGLYVADEGIGIRIEDDLLITENGAEVLSEEIMKDIDDIENYMQTGQ